MQARTQTNFELNRPAPVLLFAVWCGFLAGFAEAFALGVAKFYLGRFVPKSPHVLWMAPLSTAFLFGIVALIIILLARRWSSLLDFRLIVPTFVTLSFWNVLFVYVGLDKFAGLILSAGLGVQTYRFLKPYRQPFIHMVRWTTPWIVGLVIFSALFVHGWQQWAERRVLANLPPAFGSASNVLLIVLDTVRAHNLSTYGYARRTSPNLDRLAKSGMLFTRAYSTASWTFPAHASMFTGRFPSELSIGWKEALPRRYSTLAEALSERGYVTAGFVANTLYCGYQTGLSRGFAHYEDYPLSIGEIFRSSSLGQVIADLYWPRRIIKNYEVLASNKTADTINESFLHWLSRQDQRPFFVFLNYMDAHAPYLPPDPFRLKFGPERRRENMWQFHEWKLSAEEIQTELDAYDGAIAHLDYQLGQLFEELEKRGALRNTLVIITADHGEEFAEHGVIGHGNSLYHLSLHVPLLIAFPERVLPGTIEEPVSLRDLPATIFDLLNLESGSQFPGESLARYWKALGGGVEAQSPVLSQLDFASNLPEWYPVSKGNMQSLMTDRYHYIKNGDGQEEIYDLQNDPGEKRNLIRLEDSAGILQQFRLSLARAAGQLSMEASR
jgi:arylsulfatase A-like enzyme